MSEIGEYRFSAKIYKLGINPCVDVPKSISAAIRKRGYIPIVGKLNDFPIRTTLVPKGGGLYRLYLNIMMRRGAKVDVGDTVDITLSWTLNPENCLYPGISVGFEIQGRA